MVDSYIFLCIHLNSSFEMGLGVYTKQLSRLQFDLG